MGKDFIVRRARGDLEGILNDEGSCATGMELREEGVGKHSSVRSYAAEEGSSSGNSYRMTKKKVKSGQTRRLNRRGGSRKKRCCQKKLRKKLLQTVQVRGEAKKCGVSGGVLPQRREGSRKKTQRGSRCGNSRGRLKSCLLAAKGPTKS